MAPANHFLDSLTAQDRSALAPHLRHVALAQDNVLVRTGETVAGAVLPLDCIISVIVEMQDGSRVETRTVGRESGFGLLHALGTPLSYETVTVQVSGAAMVIDRRELAARARESSSLTASIVRHAQATLVQSGHTEACNALHEVVPRLSRWLLMTRDRLGRDDAPLTQEHLSIMLAVQRTTVTTALAELEREQAISRRRGCITITDRQRLLDRACECYAQVEEHVNRIFAEG